jgi:hypothetical protein
MEAVYFLIKMIYDFPDVIANNFFKELNSTRSGIAIHLAF